MMGKDPANRASGKAGGGASCSGGGFALILALALMAFLVLLFVGLTTFTRVETEVSAAEGRLALARQNALLGLRIAVGTLQKHAGPDERVTARAEILPVGRIAPGNRYWTGVWDAREPSRDPVWLVSGEHPEVSVRPVAGQTVVLVGEGSAGLDPDDHVHVESVGLPALAADSAAQNSGHYAFWVSDEGVKLSVGVADPIVDQNEGWPGRLRYYGNGAHTPVDPGPDRVGEHFV
jgi:hypothetical protein